MSNSARGLSEFAARFPSREIDVPETSAGEEAFPIVEYIAADSVLQGLEAHSDVQITPQIAVELGLDYVRGTLTATDEPLPRIPPLRFRGGLRYQRNAFQAGGDVSLVATQDRVFATGVADGRISTGSRVRCILVWSGRSGAHTHSEVGERDQRAVPESSVAHQGAGSGDGTEFQVAV